MLISKHFDPVLGIDIHFLVIPPAGPVPIPHPHIALVFDPFDYVPFIGATVKIGGLPRSTAGTAGLPIPHFPMGGPFVKPPMNENEIFMGSVTVLADGGPLSYTAVPSLSCHDIGLIAPPRKKKPKKSFGMVLPTSVVLSIPLGMPVMVGGAPTIDMTGVAMAGGFAALGGAFKKLRKMQKKSPRMKKISNSIHQRTKKAMDKLGVPPNVRNKVHKNICTVTGHPVDVATGKMFTDHIDFSLPGPLPLVWERTWYSTSVYDGPLGHGWHHSYDLELCEMDNAVAVRLADGRSVAFPVLNINEKSFDRQERMTLVRDAEGYALETKDRQRYRFTPLQGQAEKQLLTSLTQTTSGATINFYYNDRGQLLRIIDSGGRLIQFSHTDDGRIHKIFLPEPESNLTRDHTQHKSFCAVEHHYRNGMLVQVDDALQQPLQYQYDNTLLIKETFRSGLSFYFEYDGLDHNARCLRTWGDEGIYYRDIRYDLESNITYVKNSHGYVTTYYHNGVVPHRVVDPLNHASLTEYNEYSEIVCETNELGFKTRYEFDDFGNTTRMIRPDGIDIKLKFDVQQNLIEMIDQLGISWHFTYDDSNHLMSKAGPLGNVFHYKYHNGHLSTAIDSGGNHFNFHYDQNSNLRSVSENNREQVTFEYDALGNLLTSKNDRINGRRYFYDKLNRVRKIEEPDGNLRHFSYDGGNNITRAKDEYTDVHMKYSGMGRMVSRSQAGTTIQFEYDKEEQLIAVVNEFGRVYQFEHNERGEIITESGFDGLLRKFVKDPAGRTIRIIRPAERHTTYTYDINNRIKKIMYSDGLSKTYEYRADGQLVQATNDSLIIKWDLDSLGRLTREHQGQFWVSSEYNELSNRIRVTSSLGLDQLIMRNQRGNVLKVSTGQNNFEATFIRDNHGLEIQRNLPGGITSLWTRDKLGRPTQHQILQGKEAHRNKAYIWGLNNRLLKLVSDDKHEAVFQYNPLGNLLSARYSDGMFELRMPDSINNLFKTHNQTDREYGPAGQLLSLNTPKGPVRYQYDEEGNLISKQEPGNRPWRYAWNSSGTLAKVTRPDGKEISFEYDAFDRRICKKSGNKITRWIWDGDNPLHEWIEHSKQTSAEQFANQQLIAESIQGNQHAQIYPAIEAQGPPLHLDASIDKPITWLFEPDSFKPMAKLIGDEYYSIVTDHLGTPSVVFDKQGNLAWSAEISILGELRHLIGEKEFCPFRFPGQYEDSETGLFYNRFRYCDPIAGQYISQDPIRLSGGMAFYAYVKDPLTWTDPLGLKGGCGDDKYGSIPEEHHFRYDRYLKNFDKDSPLGPDEWYKKAQQAWANNSGGNEFERAAREFMGAPLGRGSKPVSIEGYVPDLPVGKEFGVTDIKNVQDLCNSPQLQAFSDYAQKNELPFSIVISPRTETVSGPLLDNIRKSGGELIEFDDVAQEMKFIDIGKSGPWSR